MMTRTQRQLLSLTLYMMVIMREVKLVKMRYAVWECCALPGSRS